MENRIVLENSRLKAVFDLNRCGFVSLTSPLDEGKLDFLLPPEEFPEFDVEQCEWLGNVDGIVICGGEKIPFFTGGCRASAVVAAQEEGVKVTWPSITAGEK